VPKLRSLSRAFALTAGAYTVVVVCVVDILGCRELQLAGLRGSGEVDDGAAYAVVDGGAASSAIAESGRGDVPRMPGIGCWHDGFCRGVVACSGGAVGDFRPPHVARGRVAM